jgi:hypothetical protein
MKVMIIDKRASTAFDVPAPLKWFPLDMGTPAIPDDAFPGDIIEIRMDRENGGSYLYQPPMSVEEFMQLYTLWEMIRQWWRIRKR